jgi:hypothetical protein
MNNTFLLYGLIPWFVLLFLGILNGLARDYLYKNKIGELRAHQLSSFIFAVLILFITYIFLKIVPVTYSIEDLEFLGLLWVFLTIGFEFIFGHFIMKNSWKELLNDYNVLNGRIWIMVLLVLLSAPYLVNYYL